MLFTTAISPTINIQRGHLQDDSDNTSQSTNYTNKINKAAGEPAVSDLELFWQFLSNHWLEISDFPIPNTRRAAAVQENSSVET